MDEDPFAPDGSETEAMLEMLRTARASDRLDARSHKYLHKCSDMNFRTYFPHLLIDGTWDSDTLQMFTRMMVPLRGLAARRDIKDHSHWLPVARLSVCPVQSNWDEDYHGPAHGRLAKMFAFTATLRAMEHGKIAGQIKTPMDVINHVEIGRKGPRASFTRVLYVYDAWLTQLDNDKAKVPDPDFIPPPNGGKRSVGSREQGMRDGSIAGAKFGRADADADEMRFSSPDVPELTTDGDRYSERYKAGYEDGYRVPYQVEYDKRRGTLDGERDAHKRAAEDAEIDHELTPDEMTYEQVTLKKHSRHYMATWRLAFMTIYPVALAKLKDELSKPPPKTPEKPEKPPEPPRPPPPLGSPKTPIVDRSSLNQALAKAIAFKLSGNDEEANAWALTLIELLRDADILQ